MLQDLRDALRQWRRTPIVTAVALLSLGLGIGANLTLFALADALLYRSLPVRDPHSLIRIETEDGPFGPVEATVTPAVWARVRDHQTFAASVFGAAFERVNFAQGGEARYGFALQVSGNALDVLGIGARLGRTIQPQDEESGAAPVAMISHGVWQREHGGDPNVLGRTITIDGHAFTIVGVTPASFFGLEVGRQADVVLPLASASLLRDPEMVAASSVIRIYGRLATGQTIEQAAGTLRAWLPSLREATRPSPGPLADRHLNRPLGVAAAAIGTSVLRSSYERPLLVLLGAVAIVLLIACANLAALVLARFSDRRHELGVRLALGASRWRLARSLVTDSLALAAIGAAVGLWIADRAVTVVVPQLSVPALQGVTPSLAAGIDARLMLVAGALALVTGVLAGLIPAWRASAAAPQHALAPSARSGTSTPRAVRTMRVMVVAQVALSLVLVTGAALVVRSFQVLTTSPTGVEPDRVLVAALRGDLTGPTPVARFEKIAAIQQALAAIPGAEVVSGGIITPLSGMMSAAALTVPGSRYVPPPDRPSGGFAPFNLVLPGFFHAIGTPVIDGREFEEGDAASRRGVALVNQAFVEQHFPGQYAVGRVLMLSQTELEIIGVVANSRIISLREERPAAMAFGLLTQDARTTPMANLRFVLRAAQPDTLRGGVVAALRAVDPSLSVEFRTMRDEADASVNRERLLAWLGTLLAILGLLMAAIGLHGTFAYAVSRRRHELGVRLAVGATPGHVQRLILGESAVVFTIGAILGTAGSLATARFVESLLFGVDARDPLLLALAVALVSVVAVTATWRPAHRAAHLDPMTVLRAE